MKWLLKKSKFETDENYEKRMKLATKFVYTVVTAAVLVAHLGPLAMHTVQSKIMGSSYLNIVNPTYDWRNIFWYLPIPKEKNWEVYDLRPEQHLIDSNIQIIAQNKTQIEEYQAKLKTSKNQDSIRFYKRIIERLNEDIERRQNNIQKSRELHKQRKIKLDEIMKKGGFPHDRYIIKK